MTGPVDAALDLAGQGIAVFPCKTSKAPCCEGGFKAATLDPQTIARMFLDPQAALIGVRTGALSGFDVLDIDPRHDGDAFLRDNASRMPRTHCVRTRSNGFHFYFNHTEGLRCSAGKIAPGVDIRAEGGYVIHWESAGFEVINGGSVADMPEWMLALAMKAHVKATDADTAGPPMAPDRLAPPSADVLIELLRTMPNPIEATRDDYIALNLAVQGCIRGGVALGRIDEEQADDIRDEAAEWSARWDSGTAADYETERGKWTADWSKRANDISGWGQLLGIARRLGVDVAAHERDAAAAEFAASPLPAGPATANASRDWRSMLQRTEKGARANLFNARVALVHAPECRNRLALNVFADQIVMREAPPWHPIGESFASRALQDSDSVSIAIWLQSIGIQVSSGIATEAAVSAARANRFDPVRDFLAALAWDGTPRLDSWFADALGAEDTALTRAMASKSLIAAVARIMTPGCQVDVVPLLEGPQGMGKSTTIRALFGSEWFTDHMPDLASKDAAIQLQGVWCVEFAELDKLGKAEASRAKAFITTRVDRFRRPYGRVAEDIPRRCVFWGTLNPGGTGYLRDETGNRRYWPVRCAVGWPADRKVDAAALTKARDQLWAEATVRWRRGEAHWLNTRELEAAHAQAVGQRFAEDAWAESIREFVADRTEVSVREVLASCIGKMPATWTEQDQHRIGKTLTAMGWKRKQVRMAGGQREWRYLRDDSVVEFVARADRRSAA